ncbi:MAG: PKD domain-containing protein [Paludibacteraceae bacterium]|nr:PKD domain-containing protein [Paludibacteraceae bacterium]
MKRTIIIALLLCTTGLQAQNSPYISHVYEYLPAPGQFVNELPKYEEGDDAAAMCLKVEEQIAENAGGMITLGGWGGYVVFGFDHPVVNVPGEYDFIVEGNAFYADASAGAAGGGSCEPGIVMVSVDANGNGKPDDEWYELAGSEYTNPATKHGYKVIYERPSADHVATPDPVQKYRIDTTFVHWEDNAGEEGYLEKISFHKQPYFPEWISANTLMFSGARLPDNYEWKNNQFVLYPYAYGYADNHPDSSPAAQLNIDWAVRADGTPAGLKTIDFVKVYTGLHQQCGSIGETSTEVKGARDLHPDAKVETGVESTQQSAISSQKILRNGQLFIIRDKQIYTPLGYKTTNN